MPDLATRSTSIARFIRLRAMTMPLDEPLFDQIAAAELKSLEKKLGDEDPDELEVDFSMDVMTLTVRGKDKIVINSHRAARQIWMAAYRKAWHFSPVDESGVWVWRTADDELHEAIAGILAEKLGRTIAV